MFLFFMLKTHADLFADEGEAEEDEDALSPLFSALLLFACTYVVNALPQTLASVNAAHLTNTITRSLLDMCYCLFRTKQKQLFSNIFIAGLWEIAEWTIFIDRFISSSNFAALSKESLLVCLPSWVHCKACRITACSTRPEVIVASCKPCILQVKSRKQRKANDFL